jgi:hypothetical protein
MLAPALAGLAAAGALGADPRAHQTLALGAVCREDGAFTRAPAPAPPLRKQAIMRISWVVLTGLAVAAVGCEGADSGLAATRQPIVAGTLDTGDPAIMEVLSFKGNVGARCTATLVTPRVLLLAAHCFVETPGFERFVFPGNSDRNLADKDLLPAKAVVYDPQYTTPRQGHDFAIVVLETPMAIRPMPINRASLDQAGGKTVRYVGYGLTTVGDPNSGGIKRQNTAPLADVTRLLLAIAPNPHGACEGDSGGPLLLDDGKGESIVGIASFVTNPACLRASYYQRVDTQLAWLDQQIQKYDPGGTAPPADAGAAASDGAPARMPDAGPPDLSMPAPPGPLVDARADEGAAAPMTEVARDAGPRDAARPPAMDPGPGPDEPIPTGGASGGCSYAAGARHAGRAGAGGSAALLLALACLGRRRRR